MPIDTLSVIRGDDDWIPGGLFSYGVPSNNTVMDVSNGARALSLDGSYAAVSIVDTEALNLLDIETVASWVADAIHYIPKKIAARAGSTSIVLFYSPKIRGNIANSFTTPDGQIVAIGVDKSTTYEQVVGVVAHEVWHAFSINTNFWHAGNAISLLNLLRVEPTGRVQQINDEISRRWRGMNLSQMQVNDERMGDALAGMILGYPYERILDQVLGLDYIDITEPFMHDYLLKNGDI